MTSDTNAKSSSQENPTLDQILSVDWFVNGRISTKYLPNETRVQIGKALLSLKKSVLDEIVRREGDTFSARNKAAWYFYALVDNKTGLKRETARSLMWITKRFANRPDLIRFLRWRDLSILVRLNDADVDAAINQKLENPEMTDAQFGKSLALLRRPRASK